jgi:hypothetical protein
VNPLSTELCVSFEENLTTDVIPPPSMMVTFAPPELRTVIALPFEVDILLVRTGGHEYRIPACGRVYACLNRGLIGRDIDDGSGYSRIYGQG